MDTYFDVSVCVMLIDRFQGRRSWMRLMGWCDAFEDVVKIVLRVDPVELG